MQQSVDWEQELNHRFRDFATEESHHLEEATLISNLADEYLPLETNSPSQWGAQRDFLNSHEGWNLPLGALRRIPRYLCGMTLLSDSNAINQGHYEYWRCTGAFASIILTPDASLHPAEPPEHLTPEEGTIPDHVPSQNITSMSRVELSDLCVLIHISLLGARKHEARASQTRTGHNPDKQIHSSLRKIIDHCFKTATRYGFPVLEGFAGKWGQKSSSSLQNKLEDWTRETENLLTKATLLEVNSLPEIDVDDGILSQMYGMSEDRLENPSLAFGQDSIFSQLNQVRADSLHGDESYSGPAVVTVTLSCLAFWDTINSFQFEKARCDIQQDTKQERERVDRILRETLWNPEHFYNPTTFSRL